MASGREAAGPGSWKPRSTILRPCSSARMRAGSRSSWGKMHLATMSHGQVGTVGGGAIDTALWDSKGKAVGVAVHELLGGKIRDSLPAYTHVSTPYEARKACDMGYRAFKSGM